ncbi:MAG TPA: biopolymer transporter ExbD [Chthoniobacterales bacterium]
MNFRKNQPLVTPAFQLAPMIDVLLVILVFFIVTWNFALEENELDVKVPSAKSGSEGQPQFSQVVVNVKVDGTYIINKKQLTADELLTRLTKLSELYPDQAIILRGDENVEYKHIMKVMDICRQANIWNLLFNASKPTQQ